MENNGSVNELPDEAFQPQPELEQRPTILVRVGMFMSSTAVLAALNAPPEIGLLVTNYGMYGFYIAMVLLCLFGIGFIVLGWIAADNPEIYNVATRNAIRASQLMLVIVVALYEVYANP